VAPLQLWVDSQVEQLRFSLESFRILDAQFKQQVESYNQRLVVPITRSWYRAGRYYMQYICESHEKPLGPIKAYWGRWEDNNNEAALSHLHACGIYPIYHLYLLQVSNLQLHSFVSFSICFHVMNSHYIQSRSSGTKMRIHLTFYAA